MRCVCVSHGVLTYLFPFLSFLVVGKMAFCLPTSHLPYQWLHITQPHSAPPFPPLCVHYVAICSLSYMYMRYVHLRSRLLSFRRRITQWMVIGGRGRAWLVGAAHRHLGLQL